MSLQETSSHAEGPGETSGIGRDSFFGRRQGRGSSQRDAPNPLEWPGRTEVLLSCRGFNSQSADVTRIKWQGMWEGLFGTISLASGSSSVGTSTEN